MSEVVSNVKQDTSIGLEAVGRHQSMDGECVALVTYCRQGWPRKSKVPSNLLKYWKYQGELTVCKELLFKGGRLVIPEALQRDVLDTIHEGHQGVNRCRARTRDSVWWPNIGKHIASMVESCERCTTTRVQRAEWGQICSTWRDKIFCCLWTTIQIILKSSRYATL